jgi:hypothetical protein
MTGIHRIWLCIIYLTVCLLGIHLRSNATTVIYNNFGSGQAFNAHSAWNVFGSASFFGYRSAAMPFTAGSTVDLFQIDIALSSSGSSGNDRVIVTLKNDSSGLPGQALETWHLAGLPSFLNGSYFPEALLSAGPAILLTAGQQYWVVASPGAPDTLAEWNVNSTGDAGTIALNHGSWNTERSSRGAYDVLGTAPTPEPGTLVLLGAGVVGALFWYRQR